MILVDVAGNGPTVLNQNGPRVRDALAALQQYYERTGRASKTQQRPPLRPIYADPSVRDALREAFHYKCAYCESPDFASAPLEVDHFRPIAGAIGADGTESREHYWWLTYSWQNLLLVCSDCTRAKGNRFPVNGTRASRTIPIEVERYLLLDPRRGLGELDNDSPSRHLVFLEDGTVASVTERGTVTIDVLALNRSSLVTARREVAATV